MNALILVYSILQIINPYFILLVVKDCEVLFEEIVSEHHLVCPIFCLRQLLEQDGAHLVFEAEFDPMILIQGDSLTFDREFKWWEALVLFRSAVAVYSSFHPFKVFKAFQLG